MRSKHLILIMAVLIAAGGLWFGQTTWRTHVSQKSSVNVGVTTPDARPKPGQMLRPPNPTRRFTDFTPEQRVQFAREGHGPGG